MNREMVMRGEITSCQGERRRLHERQDFGQLVAGTGRRPLRRQLDLLPLGVTLLPVEEISSLGSKDATDSGHVLETVILAMHRFGTWLLCPQT